MTQRTTWAARYSKSGNAHVIIVPREVRETLGLRLGDLIVMRIFGKHLIARRLDPADVIDVNAIPADAFPSAVRS